MFARSWMYLFAVVLGVASATRLDAQQSDTVWVWSARCQSPSRIEIRIRLDSSTVFRSHVPICRWNRQMGQGRARFGFTSKRAIVWYGYRSDEGGAGKDSGDTTAANTRFEIDLWQAGGEADGIQLGVTAAAPDGLHMNTIHIVKPLERSQTILAPGLVLDTWPASR